MSKKIFICEDETIISLDLRTTIESLGYIVGAIYYSAEKLLSEIHREKPDLVVSDINLRGKMNGVEMAKILLKDHGVRVIFITGMDVRPYYNILKELNCEFLKKPFDTKELKHKLEKHFG